MKTFIISINAVSLYHHLISCTIQQEFALADNTQTTIELAYAWMNLLPRVQVFLRIFWEDYNSLCA